VQVVLGDVLEADGSVHKCNPRIGGAGK